MSNEQFFVEEPTEKAVEAPATESVGVLAVNIVSG
jgi:hypothetical protein